MSTITRPASPVRVPAAPALPGARQLADVVLRLAATPAEWIARVRLDPADRWYERIRRDDSHEVWLISWLPGPPARGDGQAAGCPQVRGSLAAARGRSGDVLPDPEQDQT